MDIISKLGIDSSGAFNGARLKTKGPSLESRSPIDGSVLGTLNVATDSDYETVINSSVETFKKWRLLPAPRRGEIVRQMGDAIRLHKKALGALITTEMGKIIAEGEGEVQEAIDIADFAVGLSRQLYGLTMHSERPAHRMYEQWHPLGPIGVISAFNFPMAVWAWNAMIGAVCGNTIIWKPSEQVPFSALAINAICSKVAAEHGFPGLFSVLIDRAGELGKKLSADNRVPLISATGSCRMGKAVAETVSRRFGKTILELGGNNAVIVMKDADLNLVIPSILFGAVGTAGQRCTSIRRILVDASIKSDLIKRLLKGYSQIKIGDPRESGTLMGPLINSNAVELYKTTIDKIKDLGGIIHCGGNIKTHALSGLYVEPTIAEVESNCELLQEEVFAPIVYIVPFKGGVEDAIALNNGVPQGLSSAIFTRDIQNAEKFLSAAGSDCGIANVNIGTSGAEIGGAFGGEKDTGGGRESGSDSWKQYMRRQTCTINYSDKLPLAQGISFEVG